jgi:hypothetical protein
LLSDHPNPGNRTEYVNAEISTLPQRPNPTVTTAEFKQIHTQALAQKSLSPIRSRSYNGAPPCCRGE